MDGVAWKQATLPVKLGGLGIRLTEELALPAFLASIHSVAAVIASIVPFDVTITSEPAREKWLADVAAEPPADVCSQKEWDKPCVEKQLQGVFAILEPIPAEKARILAACTKESGAWLNALPASTLGTHLDNATVSVSIALHLGSPICNKHLCVCGKEVDELDRHGLSCRKSAGRDSRHASINDLLRRALVSAGIPSILKPLEVNRDDGKRPDGLTLIPWKQGRCLVWDATCADTLAASYVAGSARNAGSAAATREDGKIRKYRSLQGNYMFCPLGFETLGPWGPTALGLISDVGKRLAEKTGERCSTEFYYRD